MNILYRCLQVKDVFVYVWVKWLEHVIYKMGEPQKNLIWKVTSKGSWNKYIVVKRIKMLSRRKWIL